MKTPNGLRDHGFSLGKSFYALREKLLGEVSGRFLSSCACFAQLVLFRLDSTLQIFLDHKRD